MLITVLTSLQPGQDVTGTVSRIVVVVPAKVAVLVVVIMVMEAGVWMAPVFTGKVMVEEVVMVVRPVGQMSM